MPKFLLRNGFGALGGALGALVLVVGSAFAAAGGSAASADDEPLTPVLVELFTSQGCSSCPPADDLLQTLERNQPVNGALIIPLSEHVDYWNRLGWRDPYSSRRFSERQREYADSIGIDALWTPMMVVDGDTAIIGSRPIQAREAVVHARKAPKARLAVEARAEPGGDEVRVSGVITELPPADEQAEVWVALAEGGITTDVKRGENASKTLTHTAVVRSLTWLGSLPREAPDAWPVEAELRLGRSWRRANLRVVVFVQAGTGGSILGVTSVPLGT